MRIDILTLFPEMMNSCLSYSVIGRARAKGTLELRVTDIRSFAEGPHRAADDRPYGGGPGMVMKPEPIFRAVESLPGEKEKKGGARVILLTPQGRRFDQEMALELARSSRLILICGHYEGVDERVREHLVTDEISIGDYILTGGELAALVVVEATARLLPGVLGAEESLDTESFSRHLLEYPQYTRPPVFRGMGIPEILLSGDHEKIARWRRQESVRRTAGRRPDLFSELELAEEEKDLLMEIKRPDQKGEKK